MPPKLILRVSFSTSRDTKQVRGERKTMHLPIILFETIIILVLFKLIPLPHCIKVLPVATNYSISVTLDPPYRPSECLAAQVVVPKGVWGHHRNLRKFLVKNTQATGWRGYCQMVSHSILIVNDSGSVTK
jgi:hypothetical protein